MAANTLTGRRFGRLTVLSRAGKDAHSNVMWLCKCDCGNLRTSRGDTLKRGESKSCGCLRAENGKVMMGKLHEKTR